MTLSLNPVAAFNSKVLSKLQNISIPYKGAPRLKTNFIAVSSQLWLHSRRNIKENRGNLVHLAADSNHVATDPTSNDSKNVESIIFDNQFSAAKSVTLNSQLETSANNEPVPQISEASDGLQGPNVKQKESSSPDVQPTLKRSPLTAREKLRAARVLSRYTESKPSKSDMGMGSKVLDALRESDRGKKRSGLPEAPSNLFDDSKRGLPKQGWTFQFPGGEHFLSLRLNHMLVEEWNKQLNPQIGVS
uniref:Uncharacterized protein n=1 Tax=Nelumbo nucifera TaxID=4432 RepID=A0A822Y7P6_NELNU|nr:TPA_asm: hypothetical protein HUJ06_029531 [Nelumbo nucifera]